MANSTEEGRDPNDFYLVVVQDDLLEGAVETASMMSGSAELTYEDRLDLRGQALAALANALLEPSQNILDELASSTSMQSIVASAGLETSGPEAPEGIDLFPAIGAMAIDSRAVSIESLHDAAGIEISPNHSLSGPKPERSFQLDAPALADHLRQVGIEEATSGGSGICVGVLDSGIDVSHPEFHGVPITYAEFDSVGRRVPGAAARDFGMHGTHVAGLIAGRNCGAAPASTLAIAAVLTRPGGGPLMRGTVLQVAGGINWLMQTPFGTGRTGADLINASLTMRGFRTAFQAVLQNARNMGILTVAAVGNNGSGGPGSHCSPANYPKVIGVGAVDAADQVALFSDWGDTHPPPGPAYPLPELSAPGVGVVSALAGGGYLAMDGTSMAAPIVSGIASRRMAANPALLRSPNALTLSLRTGLAPVYKNPAGNKGGAGSIRA